MYIGLSRCSILYTNEEAIPRLGQACTLTNVWLCGNPPDVDVKLRTVAVIDWVTAGASVKHQGKTQHFMWILEGEVMFTLSQPLLDPSISACSPGVFLPSFSFSFMSLI